MGFFRRFIKFAAGLIKDQGFEYDAGGKLISCHQCGTTKFQKSKAQLNTKEMTILKMDFFDKNDKLYRVIESQQVEEIDGFPTVVKSLVKNLKTGSQTEMEFSKIKYNINLKDIFSERYMKKPPREAMR